MKLPRQAIRVLAAALTLGVLLVGVRAGRSTAPTEPSVLPKLVGLRQSDAECHLKRLEATWRADASAATRTSFTACHVVAPDPKVVRQRPAPGTILSRGDVVEIVTTCMGKLCQ